MAVVDKALTKYNKWLRRDSEDADFISNRSLHLKKLEAILTLNEKQKSNQSFKYYDYNKQMS